MSNTIINKVNIIVEFDGSAEATFDSGLQAYAYYTFRKFTGMTPEIARDATSIFENIWLKDSNHTPIGHLLDFFGKYYHYYILTGMSRHEFLDTFYYEYEHEDYSVTYITEDIIKRFLSEVEEKYHTNICKLKDWLKEQED